jgi:hypothetical protein
MYLNGQLVCYILISPDTDNEITILALERIVKHGALQNTAAARSLHRNAHAAIPSLFYFVVTCLHEISPCGPKQDFGRVIFV